MKYYLQKTILVALLSIIPTFSAADVSGKLIAYACYSCHGEKLINLALPRPLSVTEMTQTLLAFKTDNENTTIMDRITKGYTDKELEAVATYLSGL